MPPGFREGLTGLGWLEELDSESLELDPDPEPELSESRAAPYKKAPSCNEGTPLSFLDIFSISISEMININFPFIM